MQEIEKIIRAWKDDDYRMSLNTDERQALPENPAGLVGFSEAYLNQAASPTSYGSIVRILGMCLCW
jgi:mersacidin/lichenicidin family type 2 lantibiotic